jgi:hypothetical protein
MKKFQKYSNDGKLCTANAVYDALYDSEYYYMNFYESYWFEKELEGLEKIKKKSYSPEIVSINPQKLQIIIKWYDSNLNHLFFKNEVLPKNWKEQINEILLDLKSNNIYKINTYPHTFFIKNNQIKIIDLYACTDPILEKHAIKIINDKNRFRFENGLLDIKFTYDYTVKHQSQYWPEIFIYA